MAPVLGYWKIRGLAQPARLALAYKEVDFEDKLYEQGNAPEFSREEWMSVKFSLGLDFPNLPYYIDGDLKITETTAIYGHIGRKYSLNGSTEEARCRNDQIISVQKDYRSSFTSVCYNPKYEEMRGGFLEKLPTYLTQLSNYLSDRQFFADTQATMCDFCLYDVLDVWRCFEPTCLDKFNSLKQFLDRIEDLPTIKKYMQSSKFMKRPFNNKIARWGGDV